MPAIDVVVVALNAAADIDACLAPLVGMRDAGAIAQVIVVDDGSNDETAKRARYAGADRVIVHGARHGAAGARNTGAACSSAAVVWFVDADVVVHDDAAQVLGRIFSEPGIDAVFGAYGDQPTAGNFLSQYKNLVHHETHRRSAGPATTFWTGCGAVRRAAFDAVGGFDAQRFATVGMEDVDFGRRLHAAGFRIRLDPALQGEHRKRWTLFNLLRTEIRHRALPWSRMLLADKNLPDTLNVDRGERLRALVALSAPASLVAVASPWAGWPWPMISVIAIGMANRRLFDFFRRKRGLVFAIRAVAFHQIYYLYSGATFTYAWITHQLSGGRSSRFG